MYKVGAELGILPAINERIAAVQANIALAAAKRDGNQPVTLVAASKTRTPEEVLAAMSAGVTDFGENRPEDALPKIEAVNSMAAQNGLKPPRWHMIGHVQSRKTKLVAGHYVLVHSVDSLALAIKIDQLASGNGHPQEILLEVNTSGEENKYGFSAPDHNGVPGDAFRRDLELILGLSHIRVVGLMTMAPAVVDPELARPYFRRLFLLKQWLLAHYPQADWRTLSMGMTEDYPIAIEEGATIVRVGRAIFGERRLQ